MTRDKVGSGGVGAGRDPFGTARKLKLHLCARARKGAVIRGNSIYYDGTVTLKEQRSMIAACLRKRGPRKPPAGPTKKTAA